MAFFVLRWSGSHRSEKLPQVADILLAAGPPMVRAVYHTFNAIQYQVQTRAVAGQDLGAEVMDQRLYVAPVDVTTDRFMKNFLEETGVFVTHDCYINVFTLLYVSAMLHYLPGYCRLVLPLGTTNNAR